MKCRHCGTELAHTFLDLGFAPPSNAYLSEGDLSKLEKYYPLKVKVCDNCWLVQTEDYAQADELFSADYAYFSSISSSWLDHSKRYVEQITQQLSLNKSTFVIEIASNDGYLLKNFTAAGIPCLGIEPTSSTAVAAEKLGIPVLREFFGETLGKRLAKQGNQADLIIGNNVYAHVPDINDFTCGIKAALKPGGVITLEFPHLLELIEQKQFDTVYHEHFSYLSLSSVEKTFKFAGLRIWNVEKLATHGGSLRVYGCHKEAIYPKQNVVDNLLLEETKKGLQNLQTYLSFQPHANKIKDDLLDFLIKQKRIGKTVVAYGAAAKGSTLLNFAGIKPDLLAFVCDAATSKQKKYLPGSHIPILMPSELRKKRPDYVIILPWNLSSEVALEHSYIKEWGGRFVIAIPEIQIL
jgi:hypothetical protein